jgi:uncharacterized membrane protein YgcG
VNVFGKGFGRSRAYVTSAVIAAGFAVAGPAWVFAHQAADWPRTRAERTNYEETSSQADVVAFLDALQAKAGDRLWVGSMGKTTEGRDLPFAIVSRPLVTTPAEAKRMRRPVIFVQGNIHSGEVEGKEALQALLRDLLQQTGPSVLDSIVLIAVPNYNADGNEKLAPQRQARGAQNGPEMVGTRPNAQGLNLNRDYVTAEAPETRASLAMFNAWDPDLFVDLHTSDGSPHGYALTYSPSLHPAAELATTTFGGMFARDSILPLLRRRMQQRHNFAIFDYGNFGSDNPGGRGGGRGAGGADSTGRGARGGGGGGGGGMADTMPQAWRTYEHTPRYGTNYYALRGRISILSEAYSHDPFERRVKSTYAFVRELLSIMAEKRASVFAMEERSDRNLAMGRLPDVPVRARMTTTPIRGPLLHEVIVRTGDTVRTQAGLQPGLRRTGRIKTTMVNIYDRFESTRTVRAPVAYIIPATADTAVAMLRLHGVVVEKLRASWSGAGETFVVDSVIRARAPFEGHAEVRLEGRWNAGTIEAPAGAFVVRTTQPLGVLAVILLEPESDDGLATWNVLDRWLEVGRSFPVQRARVAVTAPAWQVQ